MLADLDRLVRRPGPFGTVWMTIDTGVEHAEGRNLTRWRTHRTALAERLPAAVLDRAEGPIADAHRLGPGLVLVVDTDGVQLVEHLADPPELEETRWAPVPSLSPVIRHRQGQVPHVLVLADILAKSVALARYEREIASVFDTIEPAASRLAVSGRLPKARKALGWKPVQTLYRPWPRSVPGSDNRNSYPTAPGCRRSTCTPWQATSTSRY